MFPGRTYVKNLCLKHDSLILRAKHTEVNDSNTSVRGRLELVWEKNELGLLRQSFFQKTTILPAPSLTAPDMTLLFELSFFAFWYDCQIFQASDI